MKTKCIYLLAALMTILVLAGSCSKKEEEHGEPKVTGVTKVTVSPSSLLLELGKNQRLSVTVSPSSAAASNPVSWSSSDPFVATVSSDGTVTAVRKGKAVITAQAGSKQATCEVTVEDTSYKDKEKAALIAFYKANNGDKWEEGRRYNWCSDKPLREWTGIGMTEDGKHVNHLWVDDPNLCGRIPKEIADLTELELLHLANAGDYTPILLNCTTSGSSGFSTATSPVPFPTKWASLRAWKTYICPTMSCRGRCRLLLGTLST